MKYHLLMLLSVFILIYLKINRGSDICLPYESSPCKRVPLRLCRIAKGETSIETDLDKLSLAIRLAINERSKIKRLLVWKRKLAEPMCRPPLRRKIPTSRSAQTHAQHAEMFSLPEQQDDKNLP